LPLCKIKKDIENLNENLNENIHDNLDDMPEARIEPKYEMVNSKKGGGRLA
jgi:hypothetical protein